MAARNSGDTAGVIVQNKAAKKVLVMLAINTTLHIRANRRRFSAVNGQHDGDRVLVEELLARQDDDPSRLGAPP